MHIGNRDHRDVMTAEELVLDPGHYRLIETQFPTGYVKTGADPEFDVAPNPSTKVIEVQYNNATVTNVIVQNEPGVRLPSTGGMGTGVYTAAGAGLILLALAMLLLKRRAQ